MKKNIIIVALSIAVIVLLLISLSSSTKSGSSKEVAVKKAFTSSSLSGSGNITCSYPQILHTNFKDGIITHEIPPPETNPIIMTYSNLKSEEVKIQFIDATQSISEVPAIKIVDKPDKIMLIEGQGEPYLTVHTIYKDSGVATFAKQISFIGIPIGNISMGTCVDY